MSVFKSIFSVLVLSGVSLHSVANELSTYESLRSEFETAETPSFLEFSQPTVYDCLRYNSVHQKRYAPSEPLGEWVYFAKSSLDRPGKVYLKANSVRLFDMGDHYQAKKRIRIDPVFSTLRRNGLLIAGRLLNPFYTRFNAREVTRITPDGRLIVEASARKVSRRDRKFTWDRSVIYPKRKTLYYNECIPADLGGLPLVF